MQVKVEDLHEKSVSELKNIFQPIIQDIYKERNHLYEKIEKVNIKTFSVSSFVQAMKHLHNLHTKMQGDI